MPGPPLLDELRDFDRVSASISRIRAFCGVRWGAMIGGIQRPSQACLSMFVHGSISCSGTLSAGGQLRPTLSPLGKADTTMVPARQFQVRKGFLAVKAGVGDHDAGGTLVMARTAAPRIGEQQVDIRQ